MQGRLDARAGVDADDVLARQREHAARWQTDVAEAEQADGVHRSAMSLCDNGRGLFRLLRGG